MTHRLEFLQFVLPWDDNTYKAVFVRAFDKDNKEFFYGKASTLLRDVDAMCGFFDANGKDVYVALSAGRDAVPPQPGKKWAKAIRARSNLVYSQVFYLDIDVNVDGKKPDAYPTQQAALDALQIFCGEVKLPPPSLLVDSGSGGIHVYWRIAKPVGIDEWMPIANALANATRLKGLKCDAQCTRDFARILRVPDTHNYKRAVPGVVRMGQPGAIYTTDIMWDALKDYTLRVATSTPVSKLNADLTSGMTAQQLPPVGLDEVANAGCGLIYDALAMEGRTLNGEPVWNQLMLAATFDPEPVDAAHGMSRQNPTYSFSSCQERLERKQRERAERNIGWPSCDVFHQTGAPQCKTCPHLVKGKSPFNLVFEKRQEEARQDPNHLPGDYSRDPDTGWIKGYAAFHSKEKTYGVIMPQKAYDAGIWDAQDGHRLIFKSDPGGKEKYICVPANAMHSPAETVKVLQPQGIYIAPNCHTAVRDFMTSWADHLQNLKSTVIPDALGWNDKLCFAYGEQVYEPGGTTKPAFYGDDSIVQYYRPTGNLTDWKAAAKLITDQKRPELEIIVASSFAAPLVKFASGEAVLLSVYSRESGIGKSTAMKIGQAVWGHPVKGMNGLDDTENAIMKKVSDLGNLPLFWDEIKTKGQREKLVSIAFSLAQGKNKARLTRDIKAAEIRSFSTMFVGASNDSLVNEVLRGTKGTAAGVYRVFELVVPKAAGKSPFTLTEVQSAIQDLNDSHGHAGQLYAETLGRYGSGLKKLVKAEQLALEKEFAVEPEERFWTASMATILVGAKLARDLGLCAFDVPAMKLVLANTLATMRARVTRDVEQMAGKFDAEEMINELLTSTHSDSLLITDHLSGGPGRPSLDNKVWNIDLGARLKDVWLQLAKKDAKLRMKASRFRRWIDENDYNQAQVLDILTQHYGLVVIRATIGAGSTLHAQVLDRTQVSCYEIDLPLSSIPTSLSASSGSPEPTTPEGSTDR